MPMLHNMMCPDRPTNQKSFTCLLSKKDPSVIISKRLTVVNVLWRGFFNPQSIDKDNEKEINCLSGPPGYQLICTNLLTDYYAEYSGVQFDIEVNVAPCLMPARRSNPFQLILFVIIFLFLQRP